MLKRLKIDNLVDLVICGDDIGAVPKPHPHNALSICRELDVVPIVIFNQRFRFK